MLDAPSADLKATACEVLRLARPHAQDGRAPQIGGYLFAQRPRQFSAEQQYAGPTASNYS
jgi:hypothetical protein